MTLEELQAMTDAELNTLAAVKFLWGGFVNVPSDDWKPTTDMNCAMELAEKFDKYQFQKVPVNEMRKRITIGRHTIYHESLTRGITIASILAKEDESNV